MKELITQPQERRVHTHLLSLHISTGTDMHHSQTAKHFTFQDGHSSINWSFKIFNRTWSVKCGRTRNEIKKYDYWLTDFFLEYSQHSNDLFIWKLDVPHQRRNAADVVVRNMQTNLSGVSLDHLRRSPMVLRSMYLGSVNLSYKCPQSGRQVTSGRPIVWRLDIRHKRRFTYLYPKRQCN